MVKLYMLDTLQQLTTKIGFWKTLEILSEKRKMKIKEFHRKFDEISYYQAYKRVKWSMIRKNIIFIDNEKNIGLTISGDVFLEHLKHCELLINPRSDIKKDFRWKMERVVRNESVNV